MTRDFRKSIAIIAWGVASLLLVDAFLAVIWLGMPIRQTAQAEALTAPGLLFLVTSLVYARRIPIKILISTIIVIGRYAQYTFASFYGRFIQASELHLMAANSAREFWQSITLYFNAYAVVATVVSAIGYAYVLWRYRSGQSRDRAALAWLASSLFYGFTIGAALPSEPIGAPEISFFSASTRNLRDWVFRQFHSSEIRVKAPNPTGETVEFDVLYLVGESLRADRFSEHGYPRNMTPYFHALKKPHVSFSNVSSHGDCTGRSLPYLMVAPQRPLHLDLYKRPTLFAYAKQAGFKTAFVYANENDWSEFIDPNIDTLYRNAEYTQSSDQWNYTDDTRMIDAVTKITGTPGRHFLVVETYTSHWPYGDRYQSCEQCRIYRPDNVGQPVPFSSRYRTQIINSYDNAGVYFDRFLGRLIGSLRKPTLILFTSDHGESLGEGGMWGHCSGSPEQFFVPLTLIATDGDVAARAGFDRLQRIADAPVSHSNIFPTILTYLGYQVKDLTFSYESNLFEINNAGAPDRTVLVSEIGTGADPVRFEHIDPGRHLRFVESYSPSSTH